MAMLTRWNPFRTPTRFEPTSEFDDLFRGWPMRSLLREYETAAAEMRMDVQEDDKAFRVIAEVPGAKKDDIEVSIEGNQVTIQAEVKHEETREDRRQIHSERFVGKTFRAFTLPQEIDRDKCQAHYDNGVLTLTLPKKQNAQARRIEVH